MRTPKPSTLVALMLVALFSVACDDIGDLPENTNKIQVTPQTQPAQEETQVPEPQTQEPEVEAPLEEPTPREEEPEVVEEPPAAIFMPLSAKEDVVEFVEVARYMGQWYEIATTPSFQQGSCSGTMAEYTYNDAMGWVDVKNRCYIGGLNGTPQDIQGRAEVVEPETQAKLKVIFFGQSAPYWVVALDGQEGDAPYEWAVVSVPGGQVMWILSRTKQMTDERRQAIEDHLIERGFPVDTLLDTPQGE